MTLKERLPAALEGCRLSRLGARWIADALARIEELEACVQTDNAAWAREHERAEQAEATLERVRGLPEKWRGLASNYEDRGQTATALRTSADRLDLALNPGVREE